MTFGERLQDCIKKANKSQRQVAAEINVSPTRLNYWVKNRCEPEIAHIKALSVALGVSTDFLIGNEKAAAEAPLSAEALAFARAYDKMSAYGKAIVGTVMEQEKIHKGAKRLHVLPTVHDSDLYARYLSKREAEEVDSDEIGDIITHKHD